VVKMIMLFALANLNLNDKRMPDSGGQREEL
jgi:hypothetical protein